MRLPALIVSLCLSLPVVLAAQQAGSSIPAAAQEGLDRGDALRSQGDPGGALAAYRSVIDAYGDSAPAWKRVAWAQQALHDFAAARGSFEKTLSLDPNDQEARDDLASLKLSRGLTAWGWVGGTEPGTSRTGVDGQLWYGGFDRIEVLAGGGWTDDIFYRSYKAYATSYWYFLPESFVKAGLSFHGYDYTGASMPAPDSSAYRYDPRVQLEVSHWFYPFLRGGLAYQLDVPDFEYDPSTWITTHKLTAEVGTRYGDFQAGGKVAALYDPDSGKTVVASSPSNPSATSTSVRYRTDFLYGANVSYGTRFVDVGATFITNRDLDSSYAWSVISALTVRPVDPLSLELQWFLDRYSSSAGAPYAGHYGHIVWAEARYEVVRGVTLGAGAKYVNNPGPTSVSNSKARSDFSLLLSLQYRTGVF